MTFARYAERTAFERPLTSGVAYAVRVTHAEREQFERQQGWSIKKMYSSKKQSSPSPGPGDAEVREPAEEYAPVIFAQDAYKHVISFDMLSGNVSTLLSASTPLKISSFFTAQAQGRKKSCNLWCSPCAHQIFKKKKRCAHQSSSVATSFFTTDFCPFFVLRDRITDG
jgi:hypothetical protein